MATITINSTGNMNSALDYAGNEKRAMKNNTREWLRQNGVKEQDLNTINGRVVHKAGANGLTVFESDDPKLATSLREVKNHFKIERQLNHQTAKKNQAIRIKQNFPRNDLDPLNPEDWQKANDLGVELMERAYPDYKAAVYTHLDSQLHQLHNHIIMSRVNSMTGKKFRDTNAGDSLTHFRDINDEISREQGWNVLQRNKLVSTRQVQRDLAQKGIPSYITDVQEQSLSVILNPKVKNLDDFQAEMGYQGFEVTQRGKSGVLSFHWTDQDNKKRQVRSKRMGSLFSVASLKKIFEIPLEQRAEVLQQQGVTLPEKTQNQAQLKEKPQQPQTASKPERKVTNNARPTTERPSNNDTITQLMQNNHAKIGDNRAKTERLRTKTRRTRELRAGERPKYHELAREFTTGHRRLTANLEGQQKLATNQYQQSGHAITKGLGNRVTNIFNNGIKSLKQGVQGASKQLSHLGKGLMSVMGSIIQSAYQIQQQNRYIAKRNAFYAQQQQRRNHRRQQEDEIER